MTHPARERLLTSVQLAHFVSHGSLRMDAVVPDELNAQAIAALDAGIPVSPPGTPVEEAFAPGTFARRLVDLPAVAGAIHSLVGPYATVDHHAVHIRPPHNGEAQPLHADAIIDTRTDAFDVQLMYYPHEVTLDMGGTLSVPGTHLRQINESDIGRYQNLRGQTRLTCPAGTVVFLHHGIWHGGRRNDTDTTRYMFKIRFNPTVKQRLLWNTDDLDHPDVMRELETRFDWQENASGRLDVYQRVRLWRALTGDDTFDLHRWHTNTGNRPQRLAPAL
ncbi:phytanoyl-CoA dioxygenase family protein [Stackebrandtia nassauensis]|uniref:Phytanoyl-CoA dioxygenase n=1 Tax=Stackebrandtia nassauensis (strain DSM 44728 / CIP 108903 / NRRL B-16338 / NBRC 102104 / LLR-40K-21) TaxID=446470 RepID=D3Q9F3_STANL|nr:phytanoyl-CoA dioxygenase family protein [Stackebrandtia nassauensis]ADD42635.1 hypothetical protein Snas_2960 [Stackebrandtia nassauensis DSM 44728]